MSLLFTFYWCVSTLIGIIFTLNSCKLYKFYKRLPALYQVLTFLLTLFGALLFSWIVLPIIGIYELVKTFPEAKSAIIESMKECLLEKED